MGQLGDNDSGQEGSTYGSIIDVDLDCGGTRVPVSLFRISYVGDTGWEVYTDWDNGPALWDSLMAAGADLGIRPTGGGVYGSSGRLAKGYRLMGAELESEYNPPAVGPARPTGQAPDLLPRGATAAAPHTPARTACWAAGFSTTAATTTSASRRSP